MRGQPPDPANPVGTRKTATSTRLPGLNFHNYISKDLGHGPITVGNYGKGPIDTGPLDSGLANHARHSLKIHLRVDLSFRAISCESLTTYLKDKRIQPSQERSELAAIAERGNFSTARYVFKTASRHTSGRIRKFVNSDGGSIIT